MSQGSILVVDDEESIRYTFKDFLEKAGYVTHTAVGHEDAVAAVTETEFDLLYIDIILEGRSGIELLEHVKKVAPDTEVVVITGVPTVDSASQALRLGALDYIVKPVRRDALIRSAAMALDRKRLRDAKEEYRINLDAIFHSVRDAIITVDENLAVVAANSAAEALCQIQRDQAVGRAISEWDHPCSGGCLDALLQTVSRRVPVERELVECRAHHNEAQVVSARAAPLLRHGQSGRASGGVLVVRDETRLKKLEQSLRERQETGRIIGNSREIRNILSMVHAVADVQTSVLLTGESGTGKELVADALHYTSHRRDRPLVKVNCSALSESLLESELFGHVRGAFTGAFKDKAGRFQRANGGTIFLDEIGEITPRMQLRFLRVLETRQLERVGDSSPIRVDVRIIAATNRDLRAMAERGDFREDLYYRLKVFEIRLPPLRERRDDIPLLVQHFLRKLNAKLGKSIHSVSDAVMDLFSLYHWPGNIRQLQNTLEHAFVVCPRRTIGPHDLPADFMGGTGSSSTTGPAEGPAEARALRDALQHCSYNKSEAARRLGISRRTLYRKLKRHGIAE
jgi:PAS domain S-box-containing protein